MQGNGAGENELRRRQKQCLGSLLRKGTAVCRCHGVLLRCPSPGTSTYGEVTPARRRSLMDLMGGTGFVAEHLGRFFERVTVFDLTKELLPQPTDHQAIVGDALDQADLEPFEGNYDLVVCLGAAPCARRWFWPWHGGHAGVSLPVHRELGAPAGAWRAADRGGRSGGWFSWARPLPSDYASSRKQGRAHATNCWDNVYD